ncbi:YoaK family protein [Streptomyces caeni]|uniref:YoaK family protein n=1 Tax=Streptomyces caeni TaxID=2307231 RepID=A0ABW4IT62_9ACTN
MNPRRSAALTAATVVLTMTTGMVEAVSYLALGPVFTATQTGNLLFLGFAAGGVQALSVVACSVSVAGFVVGAALGARFESNVDLRGHRWFATALLVEGAVLAVAGLVSWGVGVGDGPQTSRHYLVTSLVGAAMGMRNVTTMRTRVPDLTTTLITRALTAFISSSPLAHDTKIPSGPGSEARRGSSMTAMFAGGLLGAWMLRQALGPPLVLLAVAATVLAIAVCYGLIARHGTSAPDCGGPSGGTPNSLGR